MFACYFGEPDGFTDVFEGTTTIPYIEGSFISDEEDIEVAILVKVKKSRTITYRFEDGER